MLYDKSFLKRLDENRTKIVYARIIALSLDESPIETIEGRVTQGSINVDGDSAVRRTCSLTLVAQDFDYNAFIWGLNTKFKLEIGLENTIDSTYPKIIWFKQGTYIISSFSTSRSTNNFTISIQGKDKMCALNGELGGTLTSSVDFGTVEDVIENNGEKVIKITHLHVKDIIRNIVHLYGGEPLHNIVINDLDMSGLELLEYRYDVPMYLYRDATSETGYFDNVTLDGTKEGEVYVYDNDKKQWTFSRNCKLNDLTSTELEALVNPMTGTTSPARILFRNEIYDKTTGQNQDLNAYVAKINYGDTAGYRFTELTYPGDLIGAVGEVLTSILDKVKTMLGNFEYFYDLDGQFIFQKKKTISTEWLPIKTESDGQISINYDDDVAYTFNGGVLVTTFNNNPQLGNLRNDYSVWGERIGVSGKALPVHMRYAIDKKPVYYKALDGKIYTTDRETFQSLLEQALQDVKTNFFNKINSFKFVHTIPDNLVAPQKAADGNWTPGWWDIRDWYEYYTLLMDEQPNYTMKWYSQNDATGCIPRSEIPGYENLSGYCWLIVKQANGSYNFQHGSGDPSGNPVSCTLYHSYYDSEDPSKFHTEKLLDEEGNEIKKDFIPPYSGCANTHTYIEFLEVDVKRHGGTVYFYNPKFPSYDSMEDLVTDKIQEEWEKYLASGQLNFVDWREIIYQMAKDYYANSNQDDLAYNISTNNYLYYPSGKTGYENYYIDLISFWRDLYDPAVINLDINYLQQAIDAQKVTVNVVLYEINHIKNQITQVIEYLQDAESEEEKTLFMTTIHALEQDLAKKEVTYQQSLQVLQDKETLLTKCDSYYYGDHSHAGWNTVVFEAPQNLNFWFDFLDTEGELSQYSVKNVGCRPKAINDSSVKAIYFRETPNVIFTTDFDNDRDESSAYTYINAGRAGMNTMFSISAQGKSAKQEIDDLLYKHGYCIESATINTIPIYYLEPNSKIHLIDEETNLDGYYNVSKLSIPLTYNGTMSITATKAAGSI